MDYILIAFTILGLWMIAKGLSIFYDDEPGTSYPITKFRKRKG